MSGRFRSRRPSRPATLIGQHARGNTRQAPSPPTPDSSQTDTENIPHRRSTASIACCAAARMQRSTSCITPAIAIIFCRGGVMCSRGFAPSRCRRGSTPTPGWRSHPSLWNRPHRTWTRKSHPRVAFSMRDAACYCRLTSTRRPSAAEVAPAVTSSGFFNSILSSAMPAALSASRTANARTLASSAFLTGSPLGST